jgi:hypothetical protein
METHTLVIALQSRCVACTLLSGIRRFGLNCSCPVAVIMMKWLIDFIVEAVQLAVKCSCNYLCRLINTLLCKLSPVKSEICCYFDAMVVLD